MRRGMGISPWGASAWECPPCPAVETKRSGRRELRAEGIQRQLVHLSARRERLPLTFMSRAELGQPAAGAREKRRGHAGAGGRLSERELAPGPSRLVLRLGPTAQAAGTTLPQSGDPPPASLGEEQLVPAAEGG